MMSDEKHEAQIALLGIGFESPDQMKLAHERVAKAIATARNDALEEAAKEVECGCNGWCMDPVNCSREDAEAIRALKTETKP